MSAMFMALVKSELGYRKSCYLRAEKTAHQCRKPLLYKVLSHQKNFYNNLARACLYLIFYLTVER